MQEETWGDWRDWKDWRQRSAALIAQEICSANAGRWPVTLAEWEEAAARYNLHLYVLRGISTPAQTHDSVICVRHSTRPNVLQKRICHEIAEAVAQREGALRQFNFSSPADEHHNVARLVESDIQANLKAQARAVHTKQQAQQRRLAAIQREMRLVQEQIAAEDERLRELESLLE